MARREDNTFNTAMTGLLGYGEKEGAEEEKTELYGALSQNVRSNAKSQGEIQAAGMVDLQASAFVEGDITAGTLSVTAGAKIKGMVNVSE